MDTCDRLPISGSDIGSNGHLQQIQHFRLLRAFLSTVLGIPMDTCDRLPAFWSNGHLRQIHHFPSLLARAAINLSTISDLLLTSSAARSAKREWTSGFTVHTGAAFTRAGIGCGATHPSAYSCS